MKKYRIELNEKEFDYVIDALGDYLNNEERIEEMVELKDYKLVSKLWDRLGINEDIIK